MDIEFLQSLNINKQNSKHDFLLERQEKYSHSVPTTEQNNSISENKRLYLQDLNELGGTEIIRETPYQDQNIALLVFFLGGPFCTTTKAEFCA
jgi:hypothetical protein